jgi:hypothetical protein
MTRYKSLMEKYTDVEFELIVTSVVDRLVKVQELVCQGNDYLKPRLTVISVLLTKLLEEQESRQSAKEKGA